MKKTLIISIILFLLSGAAYAKTEGNYVGLSYINTNIDDDIFNISGLFGTNNRVNVSKSSVGVNYKYAFNYHDFFVAPGLFFDYSNVEGTDKVYGNDYKLKYRYGARIDLGYDFTDKFAIYLGGGFANNISETNTTYTYPPGPKTKISSNDVRSLGLIGTKYSITPNIDLNLEYEFSSTVAMKTVPNAGFDTNDFILTVIRAGIAYKF
jgi:opacity protein-like surface antigen